MYDEFKSIEIKMNRDPSLSFSICNCILYTAEGAIACNSGNKYDVTVGGNSTAQMPQKHMDNQICL